MDRTRRPAVEGWFTVDGDPALLGGRCDTCGTYVFPRQFVLACPNPRCNGDTFSEVELSRTGRVWSYTTNHYKPPAPYVVPAEEFTPYSVAAVELAEEKMVVLGQVKGADADSLTVGQEVELVVDTLFEDDDSEYVVWMWQPVGGGAA